jgi:Ca-activated chloride channel homolog
MHSLARCRWMLGAVVTIAVAGALGMGVSALQSRPAQASRSGERALFVSVLDKDGVPVDSLVQADFIVREDGMAREVLRAERAAEPVTISLLVDTSAAVEPYVADIRRALTGFVKSVGGKNPVSIVGFGERPQVLADYTLDVPSLVKGVERVFATQGAGSYMLQAVDETCKTLKKREFERGLIVVVTGGGPEFSDRHFQDFLPILRGCGATLDVLSLDINPPNLADQGQRNREQFIDLATRTTGGARFPLLSSMALDEGLKKLADQIARQYRVTYFRPERLVPPQKTEVSVRQTGLTVRATPARGTQG